MGSKVKTASYVIDKISAQADLTRKLYLSISNIVILGFHNGLIYVAMEILLSFVVVTVL